MKVWILLALVLAAVAAGAKEPQFAYRGLWVDTTGFVTKEKADRLLDQCRRAKINVLLPNVMVHGSVMHKSSHYMHNVVADDNFDPLAYLIEKAHAQGMQVHPWYCVYYEGAKGLEPGKPEWLCTDMDGKPMDATYFLSPQIPGVNDYLLSVIKDGLAYDVDGIHLDYIRYFGTCYDYSDLGRAPFMESHGFDPKDFLDHGERIVPPEQDPFPIRVIHTERSKTRVWEQSWTESAMDRAGVGFSFISEKPENVDALRAPGLLVLSVYYDPSPEMTDAIERYLQRGGSVLCLDGLSSGKNPRLAHLFGVKAENRWIGSDWRRITAIGNSSLAMRIAPCSLKSNVNAPIGLSGGTVVARFDQGDPAVIVNGRAVMVCFNPGATHNSAGSAQMVHAIVDWLREESGPAAAEAMTGEVRMDRDLMLIRREEWVSWKADQITSLVRRVHEAVKAKDPKLAVSVAGGFSWNEHYLIFRDGRRWLDEGLVDIANTMDYCDDIRDLRNLLDLHKASVTPEELKTFYPGLALYTSKIVNGKKVAVSKDATVVGEQLDLVRRQGYRGFTLFCSAQLTDAQIKVLAEQTK